MCNVMEDICNRLLLSTRIGHVSSYDSHSWLSITDLIWRSFNMHHEQFCKSSWMFKEAPSHTLRKSHSLVPRMCNIQHQNHCCLSSIRLKTTSEKLKTWSTLEEEMLSHSTDTQFVCSECQSWKNTVPLEHPRVNEFLIRFKTKAKVWSYFTALPSNDS